MTIRGAWTRPFRLLAVALLLLLAPPLGLTLAALPVAAAAAQEATPATEADDEESDETESETETETETEGDAEEETEGGETEGGPVDASTLTVNVELILDSSGSMAEETGDGETKIAAAKRAMEEVIAAIPEREGYNVGFRVYGQEGSNQEADRALSCRSTELLVPIDRVDKDALLAEVEAVEPTGWTPLARALEAAGDDFEVGGESLTNAVIMVTDGEETCGGDPCDVAGALNAADIALTTHVVGFGLTPEQQDAVRCIVEEGGGQLFTAADASELSAAVFSALEEVAAPAASTAGYVAGNAFGLLEEGDPGQVAVVAVGRYDGLNLPIVVRNNTDQAVESIEVSAIARAGNGDVIGTGDNTLGYLRPNRVEPGGYAIGGLYFGSDDLPADATFEDFELDYAAAGEGDSGEFVRDLYVEEVGSTGERISGLLRNRNEDEVSNPVYASIVCWDEAGELTEYGENFPDDQQIGPDDETTFEFNLPSGVTGLDGPCTSFLVAAAGQADTF